MAAKKAAGKVAKTTTTAAKRASHTVAKRAKTAAERVAAHVASPEKERSQPRVAASTVGVAVRDEAVSPTWAQEGDVLTTATGTAVDDTDNSLRVGPRGPALLQDHHLRDKIMHFDHERIPQREAPCRRGRPLRAGPPNPTRS